MLCFICFTSKKDETPRRGVKETPNKSNESDRGDNILHERMPMCVAVCVLLAIVFVLSRTGDGNVAPSLPNPNIRSSGKNVTSSVACSSCQNCEGLVDPATFDIGELRKKALESTKPHIIECSSAVAGESQAACHLPKVTILQQNGLNQLG